VHQRWTAGGTRLASVSSSVLPHTVRASMCVSCSLLDHGAALPSGAGCPLKHRPMAMICKVPSVGAPSSPAPRSRPTAGRALDESDLRCDTLNCTTRTLLPSLLLPPLPPPPLPPPPLLLLLLRGRARDYVQPRPLRLCAACACSRRTCRHAPPISDCVRQAVTFETKDGRVSSDHVTIPAKQQPIVYSTHPSHHTNVNNNIACYAVRTY
jgi:hypothetical protein